MILVTGGTGYLGQALAARLVQEGERVRILCRGSRSVAGEICRGDVTRPQDVDEAMQGVRLVYHLAALVDHYASPEALRRVNVQGTIHVVESALRHGVHRIVHCSSVSAEPGGGSTAYGRSKIEAERALAAYHREIPIVILRPGPVYDADRKNLRGLVRFARLSRLCPRLLPDVTLHLASRRNVTDAFLLARKTGVPGRAYAVCDRYPVRRSVLARIVGEEAGAVSWPVPLPLVYPLLYGAALGCEGLRALLGVRPFIDRHYLRVLTRARSYDISPAIGDLGFAPAPTETDFAAAVRACLERLSKDTVG